MKYKNLFFIFLVNSYFNYSYADQSIKPLAFFVDNKIYCSNINDVSTCGSIKPGFQKPDIYNYDKQNKSETFTFQGASFDNGAMIYKYQGTDDLDSLEMISDNSIPTNPNLYYTGNQWQERDDAFTYLCNTSDAHQCPYTTSKDCINCKK